jgi:hypothetical protein
MNDAWFSPSNPKPVISEGFATWAEAQKKEEKGKHPSDMPEDAIVRMWYGALGLLGLYILAKLFMRKR